MNLDAHQRLIAIPMLALARAVYLLGALALSLPASAGAVSFFRGDFPVGTNPTSVAVGDFNGGPPDLAVANEGTDDVSILFGNGFGQFTAAAPVSVGDAPSSIVAGSFNGDAFTDLAVASVGDDNITIRLGDGAGAFTGTGTVSTGTNSGPRAIAVGDFNDDGKTDLVSANNGSSTVSIHLGDGMGGFAADATPCTSLCAAADNPVAIAVGRFDDIPAGTPDPTLDAIVASQTDDQVLVLFGDDTGEFTGSQTTYTAATSMTDPNPSALAVGSLNPDFNSEPDLLVANQNPDQVWPGYGIVGGGGFSYGGVLATGTDPVAVAMGDLDGDGDDDGISANSGTATAIISNGGGGTAVDTSTQVGTSPRDVETGAFDGDGKADVAVANNGSNSVTVLTSLPPGQPVSVPPPGKAAKKKCKKPRKKAKKGASAAAKKKKCKKKKKRK
ncbi:MAG TPA: VCBS repeat-containing protein [Acidimicrobiales bacterium]|nr:VCBS repeat-containing protein [Acidimicrobiales bacterium]